MGINATRICLPLFLLASLAKSTIINVPADYASIQAAIDASLDGDTVLIQPGRYLANASINGKNIVVGSLYLTTGNTSYISTTVIDGDSSGSTFSVWHCQDGGVSVEGLTLTGGTGTVIEYIDPWGFPSERISGGAIASISSLLNVSHCHITRCSAQYGGGISLDSSIATVSHTVFDSNYAGDGGALHAFSSSLQFMDNTVSRNEAGWLGGGISLAKSQYASSTIADNMIASNYSSDHGGGIVISEEDSSIVVIVRNTIDGNGAHMGGGGIYCRDSKPIIVSNLIVNNLAETWTGGGVRCIRASPLIANNIIDSNGAFGGGGGGGIYFLGGGKWDRPIPTIVNNIITRSAGNWGIYCDSDTSNVLYNNVWDNEGGDISCSVWDSNISADPLYLESNAGAYYLEAGSPCVDAGNPDALYNDLEDPANPGYGLWPSLGTVRNDMGAYGGNPDNLLLDDAKQIVTSRLPSRFDLYQNYPNPFNAETVIFYELFAATDLVISIHDLSGREVANLVDGFQPAGSHRVAWDGQVGDGKEAPSGIYIARLVTPEYTKSIKMVLLK